MRRSILSAAILLFAATALAQSPQLLVTNPDNPAEKPHPIALAKAEVQLLLAGPLCQTTMTLTFSNDANRVLEGELVFPLPENATVSAYALDVGGQLVESVTVEKEKARAVFETEVRKGVDPGIIEQVQGNNFRTRIYPIPAKGSRTIRVQYVSQAGTKDGQVVYALPLHWPGSTPDLTLRIESVSKEAPVVANLTGLEFKSEGGRHMAEMRVEKASFAGDLTATLPTSAMAQAIVEKRTHSTVSVENLDPKTVDQFLKTEHYFVVNDLPQIPPVTGPLTQVKPARIAIAWDASLSRGPVDHAKEFELIKAHLAALKDVSVEVIPFRNVPEMGTTFAVANGDASEIIKFLSALPYDGGTNLSAVRFGKLTALDLGKPIKAPPQGVGYYLLFTDGLTNLGPDLPATAEAPVFALSNDPRSNYALLRRLAGDSGGQYINLQGMSVEQGVAAISDQPYSLMSVECDAKEIADVYPRLPQAVQGRIMIAGKLLAKSAKLNLNYGRGGVVMARVPMTVSQEGAVDGDLISRFWAQLKLSDLAINADHNETEITGLGKQFNLVTPYTSMIVLETVEQYLQHKVIPPKSRADVYAEFMKRIEQYQASAQKEEVAKIDRVVAMWNARLAWWNQDFKYAMDFKYKPAEEAKGGIPLNDTAGQPIVANRTALSRPGGGGGQSDRDAEPAATQAQSNQQRPAEGRPARDSGQTIASGTTAAGSGNLEQRQLEELLKREREINRPTSARRAASVDGERTIRYEDILRYPENWPAIDNLRSAESINSESNGTAITVKPWSSDTPYLKALQAAPADQAYTVYLKERKSYESSPAFYLDCADFFAKAQPELALRILTNIPESALEDGRLIRICAHRLQQLGQLDLAIDLFEKVTHLRPEEPQSFRDLALALADRADMRRPSDDHKSVLYLECLSDYMRALELLNKVIMTKWERFEEIEVIALIEANRIIARADSVPTAFNKHYPIDARLIKLLDPDLRIVMTWDTDNTDIDLHVTEPTGETCVYNHNRTTIGGALSKDFTQGYGPEEYMLKKLMPGEYKIQAHFYGSRDQKLVGPTTVQATIITHFGRADEKRQAITLRLKDAKEMVDIGTVTLKP